ncbi:unnamed protein product [Durusdinium trenchii]|uniref:Uncharacterized protein n=1 Tax=Durusdinium trenchii TaxID=1381693 RepID=A0ABP0Q1K4_9DINO
MLRRASAFAKFAAGRSEPADDTAAPKEVDQEAVDPALAGTPALVEPDTAVATPAPPDVPADVPHYRLRSGDTDESDPELRGPLTAQDPVAPTQAHFDEQGNVNSDLRSGDLPDSPSEEITDNTLTTTGRRRISTSDSTSVSDCACCTAPLDSQVTEDAAMDEESGALAADKAEEVTSSAAQFFQAVDREPPASPWILRQLPKNVLKNVT